MDLIDDFARSLAIGVDEAMRHIESAVAAFGAATDDAAQMIVAFGAMLLDAEWRANWYVNPSEAWWES